MIDQMNPQKFGSKVIISKTLSANGPLAQSAERGADIVNVVSSTLTRTIFLSVPFVQRSVGNVRIKVIPLKLFYFF